LYDASKPITEALICEWSVLREKSKDIACKASFIAKGRFGKAGVKPQKCPHCGYKGDFKPLKMWKYSLWNVTTTNARSVAGDSDSMLILRAERKAM